MSPGRADATFEPTSFRPFPKALPVAFKEFEERDDRVPEGIQSEDLNKIRSNAGDKKTSGVEAEKKLNELYGNKYRIRLDHQILTDHGAFYPQALYNDLVFELKLAAAEHVVRGSDATKLKYKLTNIQLEYEMIRSKEIADEAFSAYSGGKEFAYDHIQRAEVVTFAKGSETRLNLKVNPQRRSLKGILLLFIEQYAKGARISEKYINPDLTKVSVTVNGSPNMLYNNGIEGMDIWEEVKRFFMKEKNKTQHMTLQKFYTEDKFGLLIDLRSMVKRLTDKDVEKYFKRYEAYVGAKTTENLIDSALTLFTKAASLFVPLKNIEALQKELKNDYIINNELSNLVGGLSFKYGKFLAPASVALITAKHIDYSTAPQATLESEHKDLPE
ncbi:uncharacterized protein LOC144628658 [Oculina patagonica]